MVDVDGVVGGLVEAVEDADTSARFCGGAEDGQREGLFIHYLRAAEGEHEAAGRHFGNGGGVEALVGP